MQTVIMNAYARLLWQIYIENNLVLGISTEGQTFEETINEIAINLLGSQNPPTKDELPKLIFQQLYELAESQSFDAREEIKRII